MFDETDSWNELVNLWPKKQGDVYWARDRVAFAKKVRSNEDFEKLKNHLECLLEDNHVNKLGSLANIINKLFSSRQTPDPAPVVSAKLDQEELYKKTNNPELSKVFTKIWEIWPRSPDFVERRNLALETFLVTARVTPLTDIENACTAYASAFADGSMVYPRSLKNFLLDKELFQEWLSRNDNSKLNEIGRRQFEVAYAWFPSFQGKNLKKTKEASWITYWRCVTEDEKLDFLATVKLYRSQRRADMASNRLSEEESATYTKSFVSFVGEWRQMYSSNKLMEAKGEIFAGYVATFIKELGIDIDNIWGVDDISSFFVRVLTYLTVPTGNIKNAIKEALIKTINTVNEAANNSGKVVSINNLDKACEDIKKIDVDSVSALLYKKVVELKTFEMPPQEVIQEQC